MCANRNDLTYLLIAHFNFLRCVKTRLFRIGSVVKNAFCPSSPEESNYLPNDGKALFLMSLRSVLATLFLMMSSLR